MTLNQTNTGICDQTAHSPNGGTIRCQLEAGHEGRCSWHRRGSQGGSMLRWWGANPAPYGDLTHMSHADLAAEVRRLRDLLNGNGVAW